MLEVASHPDAEAVVTGIVGCAGLGPTCAAISKGKDICLANKETLIAGPPLAASLALDVVYRPRSRVPMCIKDPNTVLMQSSDIISRPLRVKVWGKVAVFADFLRLKAWPSRNKLLLQIFALRPPMTGQKIDITHISITFIRFDLRFDACRCSVCPAPSQKT